MVKNFLLLLCALLILALLLFLFVPTKTNKDSVSISTEERAHLQVSEEDEVYRVYTTSFRETFGKGYSIDQVLRDSKTGYFYSITTSDGERRVRESDYSVSTEVYPYEPLANSEIDELLNAEILKYIGDDVELYEIYYFVDVHPRYMHIYGFDGFAYKTSKGEYFFLEPYLMPINAFQMYWSVFDNESARFKSWEMKVYNPTSEYFDLNAPFPGEKEDSLLKLGIAGSTILLMVGTITTILVIKKRKKKATLPVNTEPATE